MIDVKDLPSIELACRLSEETSFEACIYCMKIAKRSKDATWEQDATWETAVLAASAGYVAGVRHERKRQRQKATAGKQPAPGNITGQELELLAALRQLADADRTYIFQFAKYMRKQKEKEKEPADAATRQQACTE